MLLPDKGQLKQENEEAFPIRNRSENSKKTKHAVPRIGSGNKLQEQVSGRTSHSELQFINLLGTQKHDTEGRNTVRSHARRHAWRNQRQVQDERNTRRALRSINEYQSSSRSSAPADDTPLAPTASQPQYILAKSREEARLRSAKSADTARRLLATSKTTKAAPTSCPNFPSYPNICSELATISATSPTIQHIQLTNGHSDPFDVFPIPFAPRVHHLIHYSKLLLNLFCLTTLDIDTELYQEKKANSLRPEAHELEDPNDRFSCYVGSCPSLLYATLAWVSALAGPGMEEKSPESEYYLHMSISAINRNLADLHRHGTLLTDGTIAAVACLTNMENMIGDQHKHCIHMNGLRQMVSMRGGMDKLGMNGVLRRLILWADLFSATRWQKAPFFPLLDFPNLQPLSNFRSPSTPKPFFAIVNEVFMRDAMFTGYEQLLHLMPEINELAHFLDHAPAKCTELLNRASFADRVYIVEHKILTLISQRLNDPPSPSSIMKPMLHAVLLYMYTNIRLTPITGHIRRTLVSRLQNQLQQGDLDIMKETFPHEMRWIFFLGGGAAEKGSEEMEWFVKVLRWVGLRREWGSWDKIVLRLKGMEGAFLGRVEEFWKEVSGGGMAGEGGDGGRTHGDCPMVLD